MALVPENRRAPGFCIVAPHLTHFLMLLVTLTSSTPSGRKRHLWRPRPRPGHTAEGRGGGRDEETGESPIQGQRRLGGSGGPGGGTRSVRRAPLTPQFQTPRRKAGCDSTRGGWDPGAPRRGPTPRPRTGGQAGAPGPAEWPPASRHISSLTRSPWFFPKDSSELSYLHIKESYKRTDCFTNY